MQKWIIDDIIKENIIDYSKIAAEENLFLDSFAIPLPSFANPMKFFNN